MTMIEEQRSTRKVRRCGDSGGKRKNGKACKSTRDLSKVTGRCGYHDPLRVDSNATTPVYQSRWQQARRQKYAEWGAMMVGQTLDRLRAELNTRFFLYETAGDLEPLLMCISAHMHLDALLADVEEGKRMSNREIDRFYPSKCGLPADALPKVAARVTSKRTTQRSGQS